MKKCFIYSAFMALLVAFALISCSSEETYADKKNRQNDAIKTFIASHNIKVISQDQFKNQNNLTDFSKNEYVLFDNTGIYMQIERIGAGEKLKNGESAELLCRFSEWSVFGDSLYFTNISLSASYIPDRMSVVNKSGIFTGNFTSGLMYQAYGASVPSSWLVPLSYINIGRQNSSENEIAKVNMIVPADQGTATASANVIPYFYTIYYQRN